jgi:hypothetical protein
MIYCSFIINMSLLKDILLEDLKKHIDINQIFL